MNQTWTELVDDIKVRGMIPTSQQTFTEARLLALANAELRSRMLPLISKVREGYYSYDLDTAINQSGIYDIPARAIGGKLENVCLYSASGEKKDLSRYWEDELSNLTESPESPGFYIKRSQVFTLPKVPSGFSFLRQTYLLRPPTIIATEDGSQITGINTGTKTLTFDSVPSTFVTGARFDLVQGSPHFDTLGIDLVITAVTSTTVTFSATLPDRLAVGDWLSLAGESPVVQVPVELFPLLAQYVANTCLKSQTDLTAYKAGVEDAKEMKDGILGLISPRVEKEGKKVVNRTGILRRGL